MIQGYKKRNIGPLPPPPWGRGKYLSIFTLEKGSGGGMSPSLSFSLAGLIVTIINSAYHQQPFFLLSFLKSLNKILTSR
jgi:hypothetical protein